MYTSIRTFKSQPSLLYIRAVSILRQLIKQEGLDSVQRVYAQATWPVTLKQYIESNELKITSGTHNITRLTTSNGLVAFKPIRLRCEDHSTLFLKDGKPYSFITQPYALNLPSMRQLANYCEENDLDVFVNSFQSWHFPGSSLMIEIKKNPK